MPTKRASSRWLTLGLLSSSFSIWYLSSSGRGIFSGYGLRVTGYGVRGTGYGVRGTGYGVRGTGYGVRGNQLCLCYFCAAQSIGYFYTVQRMNVIIFLRLLTRI